MQEFSQKSFVSQKSFESIFSVYGAVTSCKKIEKFRHRFFAKLKKFIGARFFRQKTNFFNVDSLCIKLQKFHTLTFDNLLQAFHALTS